MTIKHTIAGEFHQVKGKLNEVIGSLKKDELLKFNGDVEKLAGHLQKKHSIPYDQARIAAGKMMMNFC